MTNEEKAMLIAREVTNKNIKGKFDNCFEAAMKMAEWKDSQLKSAIESCKNAIGSCEVESIKEALDYIKQQLIKE